MRENQNNFVPDENLNSAQNDLLKKKLKSKIDAEIKLLSSDKIIVSGELFDKINRIFIEVLRANPSIPQSSLMVLYRSNDFNAFTMGDNIIFMHIGLFDAMQNEAQIALVICHEIAHNMLNHVRNSLVDAVIQETDKEIKKEVSTILKSDYGQVSALNALLVPRILESREKSRKNELDADSLGLVLLRNTKYDSKSALSLFHAMEKQKMNESNNVKYSNYFHLDKLPTIAEINADYTRESSLGSFSKDESKLPYLATHPYERQRFYQLANQLKVDTTFSNYTPKNESDLAELELLVSFEMIENSWKNRNLSDVVYHSIKLLESNPDCVEAKQHLSAAFNVLGYLKKKRLAGKYLQLQNPKYPEDYDRVCALVYAISPNDCAELYSLHSKDINFTIEPLNVLVLLYQYAGSENFVDFENLWNENQQFIHKSHYSFMLKELENHLYSTKRLLFLKLK